MHDTSCERSDWALLNRSIIFLRNLGTGSIRTARAQFGDGVDSYSRTNPPVSARSGDGVDSYSRTCCASPIPRQRTSRSQFGDGFDPFNRSVRSGDGFDSYNLIMPREPNPPSADRATSFLRSARQGILITLEMRPHRVKTQPTKRHAFLDQKTKRPRPQTDKRTKRPRPQNAGYMTPPGMEHHGPWESCVRITGPSLVMAMVFS